MTGEPLDYEQWFDENYDDLSCELHEIGAHDEGLDFELWCETRFQTYLEEN